MAIPLALGGAALAGADGPLEEIRLISLSEVDQTAVVRTGDGELELLSKGEPLPGTSARILEVLPDRLVIEDDETAGPVRMWLFRDPADGQRLQRLDREPPALPALTQPRPAERATDEAPAPDREP